MPMTEQEWAAYQEQVRQRDLAEGKAFFDKQAQQQQAAAAAGANTGFGRIAGAHSSQQASNQRAQGSSYLGQYGQKPGVSETLDQQVYRDADAMNDANSNPFKAYNWQGPSMASREQLAQQMQGRAAIQADYSGTQGDFANAAGARQAQVNALNLYGNAAVGNGPSAAQAQLQQGLDASNRQQMSMAASARGGGMARAAAMRGAMMNAGDMGLQASQQAAQLRAKEMQDAMAGYAGVAGNIRGQDYGAAGMRADMANNQANFGLQSRAQNDQASQFYQGQAMGVGGNMTSLAVQREQERRQANLTKANLNNQIHQQDKAAGMGAVGTVGNIATGGFGAALTAYGADRADERRSDERAKKNIRDAGKDVDAFLDGLAPSKYRYKAPERDGDGEHVSVMAQQLEKSAIGKRMVREDEHGKLVDYGKGLPAVVASLARLNSRLRAVEKPAEPGLPGRVKR